MANNMPDDNQLPVTEAAPDAPTSVSERGLGGKNIPGHIIINPSASEEQAAKAHWYVVHTYSGHEARVAETLRQRIATLGQTDKFFELMIPTQNKIIIRHGKKSEIREKIFPGYLLVKMSVDDDSWLVVRTTQGVTGFVGVGSKPTPLSPSPTGTPRRSGPRPARPKYHGLRQGLQRQDPRSERQHHPRRHHCLR